MIELPLRSGDFNLCPNLKSKVYSLWCGGCVEFVDFKLTEDNRFKMVKCGLHAFPLKCETFPSLECAGTGRDILAKNCEKCFYHVQRTKFWVVCRVDEETDRLKMKEEVLKIK